MRVLQQIKVQQIAAEKIHHLYKTALNNYFTSKQITNSFLQIINDMPKGTPRHVRSFLNGVRDTLHNLHRKNLEFCYVVSGTISVKGNILTFGNTIVSVEKSSLRYYGKFEIPPSKLQSIAIKSGFFYKDTDRPFYVND